MRTKFYSTEMANQLRIVVVTCLVLFIVMEDAKRAVLAGNLGKRASRLEEKVEALEETCKDKCKRKYT